MDSRILAQKLAEFEDEHFQQIERLTFRGRHIWPYIKVSYYFYLIRKDEGEQKTSGPVAEQRMIRKLLKKMTDLVQFSALLLKLKLTPKHPVLYLAFSVDKIKFEEGASFVNQIVDGIHVNNKGVNSLYLEISHNGDYRLPSLIKADVCLDKYLSVLPIFSSYYKDDKEIDNLAQTLYELMSTYFEMENGKKEISLKPLKALLLAYASEYLFYSLILKATKPKVVISSEKVGTALFGVTEKLKIAAIDLQHGVIDKYHPQYIYSKKLKSIKGSLSLPTYVGVFGQIHKNLMIANGFWDIGDIKLLGSYRIEHVRAKYNFVQKPNESKIILIPTQWNLIDEFLLLIKNLLEFIPGSKYKVVLKLHPLEPKSNLDKYAELKEKSGNYIEFFDKSANTYDLIAKSFVVMGFDSAVLLEATTLQKPVITIASKVLPNGILGYYNDVRLEKAIKKISLTNVQELLTLLERMSNDYDYYSDWVNKCEEVADYLFSKSYVDNCKDIMNIGFVERSNN